MYVFASAWLVAQNSTINGNASTTVTVSNIPRGTNVFASIALSYFTQGVGNPPGAGGCAITAWQVFNADGSTSTFTNTDFALNSLFVDNCASITFEVGVNDARAYAIGTVFAL